jgi:hypothetical protein
VVGGAHRLLDATAYQGDGQNSEREHEDNHPQVLKKRSRRSLRSMFVHAAQWSSHFVSLAGRCHRNICYLSICEIGTDGEARCTARSADFEDLRTKPCHLAAPVV